MKKILFLFFAAMMGLATVSCELLDPDDIIPGYVQVDSIQFVTSTNGFAIPDHNITEIWTDVNGRSLGIYEVPFTVPAIAEGDTRLSFRAGIYADGVRELKVAYPFYEQYVENAVLLPPNITTVTPQFRFIEGVENNPNNTLIENFENGNPSYMSLDGDASGVTFEGNDLEHLYPKGGNFSGVVKIPAGKRTFTIDDNNWRTLPMNTETYLEISYKSDIDFQVGIMGLSNTAIFTIYDTNVRANSNWRKLYVFLQDDMGIVAQHLGIVQPQFKVSIRVNADIQAPANLALDNIRLMRYKQQ